MSGGWQLLDTLELEFLGIRDLTCQYLFDQSITEMARREPITVGQAVNCLSGPECQAREKNAAQNEQNHSMQFGAFGKCHHQKSGGQR